MFSAPKINFPLPNLNSAHLNVKRLAKSTLFLQKPKQNGIVYGVVCTVNFEGPFLPHGLFWPRQALK